MVLMMHQAGDKFVGREEIAQVKTPACTSTWHPVPHINVIEAVDDVIQAHGWTILQEQYGLAREGQKMFGVIRINKSNSPEWSRCIGIRNSHDQSFAVGLSAGISVMVCSNLAFGGTTVIKRRHTSRIELSALVDVAMGELENEFLTLETVCEELKFKYIKDDDARAAIVKAAECNAINSSDIVPVFQEFKKPRHEEFAEPTRWALLNAFTETVKKYTPGRVDMAYRKLTDCFGLDGNRPMLWNR